MTGLLTDILRVERNDPAQSTDAIFYHDAGEEVTRYPAHGINALLAEPGQGDVKMRILDYMRDYFYPDLKDGHYRSLSAAQMENLTTALTPEALLQIGMMDKDLEKRIRELQRERPAVSFASHFSSRRQPKPHRKVRPIVSTEEPIAIPFRPRISEIDELVGKEPDKIADAASRKSRGRLRLYETPKGDNELYR